MTEPVRLSADEARRIVLAAQGFGRRRRRGGVVTRTHLREVLQHVGVIQIDSVNVLARSQELVLFSRLGPHPRTLIPDAVAAGELFEYWAHAACLIPTEHHHLYRWRMARNAETVSSGQNRHDVVGRVLEQVRARGPLAVGDVEGRIRTPGTWWNWDDTKVALEWLFSAGVLSATRRPDFGRLYDLTERVIPASVLAVPTPPEPEARRELVILAARSLGVATVGELATYHNQKLPIVRSLLPELVAAGRLVPVEVDGWGQPAFLHPDVAGPPRTVRGHALLSPFDSLVWDRARTERVFSFRYRLEIYVPAPQRVYGYYVLPFLLDGHLAARVDLKADRANGVLRVQAAHVEDDLDSPADRPAVAGPLAAELADLARWLELGAVGVVARGNLATDVRAAGGFVELGP